MLSLSREIPASQCFALSTGGGLAAGVGLAAVEAAASEFWAAFFASRAEAKALSARSRASRSVNIRLRSLPIIRSIAHEHSKQLVRTR